MDFDLRTKDSAISFVEHILGMNEQQLKCKYNFDLEDEHERLWEYHYNQLKNIDANSIRIWAFHITGCLDNCQNIKREGLRNLHHMLSTDSKMARIFRKYGLEFDIESKLMFFEGTAYNVNFEKYRNRCNLYGKDEVLRRISYRLCNDYCVNGFMSRDNYLSYSPDIHIRPEFIVELVNMFPKLSELDSEWRRCSTSYKVNFFTYLNQLERHIFDLDACCDPPYAMWHDLNDNDKVIKCMLDHAISRILDEPFDDVLYIRKDLFVPPEQIFNCEKI